MKKYFWTKKEKFLELEKEFTQKLPKNQLFE